MYALLRHECWLMRMPQLAPKHYCFGGSPKAVRAMLCALQIPSCASQGLGVLGVLLFALLPHLDNYCVHLPEGYSVCKHTFFLPWIVVLLESDTRLITIMHEQKPMAHRRTKTLDRSVMTGTHPANLQG